MQEFWEIYFWISLSDNFESNYILKQSVRILTSDCFMQQPVQEFSEQLFRNSQAKNIENILF